MKTWYTHGVHDTNFGQKMKPNKMVCRREDRREQRCKTHNLFIHFMSERRLDLTRCETNTNIVKIKPGWVLNICWYENEYKDLLYGFYLWQMAGVFLSEWSISKVSKERIFQISVMTKLVPSPDWFIGLDSLDLCSQGSFVDSVITEVSYEL